MGGAGAGVCFCQFVVFGCGQNNNEHFLKTTRIELCLVLLIISILLVFTNEITDFFTHSLKILI